MNKKTKIKLILYSVFVVITYIISRICMTFAYNVKTAFVIEGLKNGNNSIAEYTYGFPDYCGIFFSGITILLLILIAKNVIKEYIFGGENEE